MVVVLRFAKLSGKYKLVEKHSKKIIKVKIFFGLFFKFASFLYKEGEMINDMMLRSAGMKATLIRAFICNSVTFGTVALVLKVYDTLGKDTITNYI